MANKPAQNFRIDKPPALGYNEIRLGMFPSGALE